MTQSVISRNISKVVRGHTPGKVDSLNHASLRLPAKFDGNGKYN